MKTSIDIEKYENQLRRMSDRNIDTSKYDIGTIISVLTVLASLCLAILVLTSATITPPVIEVLYTHPELLNTPVASKDHITSEYVYTREGDIPGEMYAYAEFCLNKNVILGRYTNKLILKKPGSVVSLDTRTLSLGKGCYNASFPVNIPSSLPAGDYLLETVLSGGQGFLNGFRVAFLTVPVIIK